MSKARRVYYVIEKAAPALALGVVNYCNKCLPANAYHFDLIPASFKPFFPEISAPYPPPDICGCNETGRQFNLKSWNSITDYYLEKLNRPAA